jgi:flagellar secretion chaperone FliS
MSMIDNDAFLRQEVESATPAKLRWLLLQKAHGLTIAVQDLWRLGQAEEAQQWVILIQEIFTELLNGIVDPKHELARQQSDLFVFLNKLLLLSGQTQDIHAMESVTQILEIEKDTWEMLVRRDVSGTSTVPSQHDEGVYASFELEA